MVAGGSRDLAQSYKTANVKIRMMQCSASCSKLYELHLPLKSIVSSLICRTGIFRISRSAGSKGPTRNKHSQRKAEILRYGIF